MTPLVLGLWAFGLELLAWLALTGWGWQLNAPGPAAVMLAVAVPALPIVFWGCYLSPRAARPLPEPLASTLRLVILGTAAALSLQVWPHPAGLAFGAAVLAWAAAKQRLAGGR